MEWLAHAALVHVPLALGILFPISYFGALWSRKTDWLPAKIWYVIWALGVVQIVATWLAYASGERSKVLSSADAEQILRHENLALQFFGIWIAIVLLLTIAAWVKQTTATKLAHACLIVLIGAQIFVCISLGEVGGSLVVH